MPLTPDMFEYLSMRRINYSLITNEAPLPSEKENGVTYDDVDSLVHYFLMKMDGKFALVLMTAHENLDVDRMRTLLGVKHIRIVHPDEVEKAFPKSKNLILSILNRANSMRIYCSKKILDKEFIIIQTDVQGEIIRISVDDFIKLARPIVGSFTDYKGYW